MASRPCPSRPASAVCRASTARIDRCCGPMRFAVYQPPQAVQGPCPVLYYLAGLTCTEETATIKAGAQRLAAEFGMVLVMPDTSPRDTGIEAATGDWEFGEGAGFYVDATQAPYAQRFNMHRYVVEELPALIADAFSGGSIAQRHLRSLDGRSWRADHRPASSGALSLGVGLRADRGAQPGAVGAQGAAALSGRGPAPLGRLRCLRAGASGRSSPARS